MARRSNKTAHVLNLLAGHDTQNSTEETTTNETAPSSSEAAPAEEAAEAQTGCTVSYYEVLKTKANINMEGNYNGKINNCRIY